MTTILVTGGNGFVGRHLVPALLDRGDSVRVLALPGEDASELESRGVEVYRGDVREPATLAAPMRGTDAVLHLAAMMDVWRPLRDYHAVNVTGTENVCRAALATRVRRLVHMSSSSVYGTTLRRRADESSALAPFPDPYPITKAAGDLAVQGLMEREGLPAVIIRPDQIFGPGDQLHFGRMADRLAAGRSVIVGSGDNAVPLVYVTDAVQGLLLALDSPHAAGQAYNITSDEALSQRELLHAIATEIGASPPRVHVPYRVLYAAAWLAEQIAARTPAPRPPLTRLGVAFIATDNRYPIDKARRELGYAPRVALRDGVRLTARWYRQRDRLAPAGTPGRAAQQVQA
jgi:nucleoside-diphosphate-sugar epimerase